MRKKANFTYILLWIYIGIDCDGKHGQRGGERDRGRGRIGRANESKSDDERGT